jgi:hypothetical protein
MIMRDVLRDTLRDLLRDMCVCEDIEFTLYISSCSPVVNHPSPELAVKCPVNSSFYIDTLS